MVWCCCSLIGRDEVDAQEKNANLVVIESSVGGCPTNNALLITSSWAPKQKFCYWAPTEHYKLQKCVCNVYALQLSFHFAHHRCWLGVSCFFSLLMMAPLCLCVLSPLPLPYYYRWKLVFGQEVMPEYIKDSPTRHGLAHIGIMTKS